MIWSPVGEDRNLLYALSWNSAMDAKVAFDAQRRVIIDLNPAAEALTGFSRSELIGQDGSMLHPENERERIRSLVRNSEGNPARLSEFHIQKKDGSAVPVMISFSEAWMLAGREVGICGFRDITEQKEQEHRLAAQSWALAAYGEAALALGRADTQAGLLQAICEAITRESVYVAAGVGIAEDTAGKPIRIAASAGSRVDYLNGMALSWQEGEPAGEGPSGVCVRTNTVQILDDAESSPAYGLWRERARQFGIRSLVSIPISIEGGWRGALIVYAASPHAFGALSVEVFGRLVEQVVHGIRALDQKQLLRAERQNLARTQTLLTEALSAMVAPIVTAMEMRDPYTSGHQGRVAHIACAIGRELGWSEERLHGLRVAALVHDIGKISIPSEILTKPGKLTAAERALICCHSETGYAILKDVPFAWPVATIVRQHHERLDGSGYPGSLKENEILPEAKILAVADVVEAMVSFRPYRAGIDLKVVLKEIEDEAGSLLDPEAVRICVKLFRHRQFTVPGWAEQATIV